MSGRLVRALALGATLVGAFGCASSGPYWNQADREAAEANEERERLARSAAAAAAASVQPQAQEAVPAAEVVGSPAQPPPAAEPPVETDLPAMREPAEIEQSDLESDNEAAADQGAADQGAAVTGPQALYDQSLADLEARRVPEAEAGFRRFLAENPDSDLADNAQFWLAESALRQTDVAAALAGFRAVVENHPEGNKVPDALLKVGYCLATLGEAESAATVYRELLARFPESAAAETARQRLAAP